MDDYTITPGEGHIVYPLYCSGPKQGEPIFKPKDFGNGFVRVLKFI
jgi:hypothetical protein